MARKKSYLNLFSKEGPSDPKMERARQMAMDKKSIEQMKASIQQKLKDPQLARKAALIIEEMLKEPAGKTTPKDKKSA